MGATTLQPSESLLGALRDSLKTRADDSEAELSNLPEEISEFLAGEVQSMRDAVVKVDSGNVTFTIDDDELKNPGPIDLVEVTYNFDDTGRTGGFAFSRTLLMDLLPS